MSTITVGELIAVLSKFDPTMPVIQYGEGYDEVRGDTKVITVEPVPSTYHAFEEVTGRPHGYTPSGPAFEALFLS